LNLSSFTQDKRESSQLNCSYPLPLNFDFLMALAYMQLGFYLGLKGNNGKEVCLIGQRINWIPYEFGGRIE